MKENNNNKSVKKDYLKPTVRKVTIDKDISVIMMSLPPSDPGFTENLPETREGFESYNA